MNCWSPFFGRSFDLEFGEPNELPACRSRLNQLLDEALEGKSLTRRELLSVLRDRYKEYKRSQLLAEARRRTL